MKPHVDLAAALAYLAGPNLMAVAVLLPQGDHAAKVATLVAGSVTFSAGLLLRLFFNRTSDPATTAVPAEATPAPK